MSRFEKAVDQGLEGLVAISTGSYLHDCDQCPDDIEYNDGVSYDCEPSFSWSPCDICGSHLGGDREVCHGIFEETEELWHGKCCVDCVMYLANGDIPDNWE